ncbi:hypothetical protein RAO23_12305, partial [Lacticaseibacillus paracasei]|uniref:hypothetical protein n=1 Tax=Lacticaseibacillus paracasei TaxID=1597 RepID=UPI002F264168
KRFRSRLTTSATRPGRCVVCTAEPHLAYDCSALALSFLKSYRDKPKGEGFSEFSENPSPLFVIHE